MPQHLGALADLIQRTLGVATMTRVSDVGVTVGLTAAPVLRQNPNRLAAVFVNLSANAMYLAPLGAPSSTRGIRIAPTGGNLGLRFDEDFDLVGYEWSAVADGAASAYFLLELIAYTPQEA